MQSLYDSLKLLGYKINELPNGFILAQAPNKNISLFDNKLKVIQNNLAALTQISDNLYLGRLDTKSNDKIIWFDSNSNILEKTDTLNGSNYTQRCNALIFTDSVNEYMGVYEKNLLARFKFKGEMADSLAIKTIIKNANGYKLLAFNEESRLVVVATNMRTTKYNIKHKEYIDANNHYIHKYIDKPAYTEVLLDYNQETILEVSQEEMYNDVYIDTHNLDNDTYVTVYKDTLTIVSPSKGINNTIQVDCKVNEVEFTSNDNVLSIHTAIGEQFLNIHTGEMSKQYDFIYSKLGLAYTLDKRLYAVNIETFEEELKFSGFKHITVKDNIVIVSYEDREEYFTSELKPLIHDFECKDVW